MRLLALLALAFLLVALPARASPAAFELEVAMDEQWAKPQSVVVFPVNVTNLGASPVKLKFELVEKTGGVQAVTPGPVTLQGSGQPIHTLSIPFVLQSPYRNGYTNDDATARYRASPVDPESGAAMGEARELAFTVHTRGFYAPGPQFFGAMLAIAVAALLLRRR